MPKKPHFQRNKGCNRNTGKQSYALTGNQKAILMMTCLFISVLIICRDYEQPLAWVFLLVTILAAIPSVKHYKNSPQLKRILKALVDLFIS